MCDDANKDALDTWQTICPEQCGSTNFKMESSSSGITQVKQTF